MYKIDSGTGALQFEISSAEGFDPAEVVYDIIPAGLIEPVWDGEVWTEGYTQAATVTLAKAKAAASKRGLAAIDEAILVNIGPLQQIFIYNNRVKAAEKQISNPPEASIVLEAAATGEDPAELAALIIAGYAAVSLKLGFLTGLNGKFSQDLEAATTVQDCIDAADYVETEIANYF